MQLDQQQYEVGVFLTKLSYLDLPYPSIFHHVYSIDDCFGLRVNVFDRKEFYSVIICGTNGLSIRDWIANIKVALGIVPIQHKKCLDFLNNNYLDKPIVIFSHSLGGGIGEYVVANSARDDVSCIAFNGCGVAHLGGYVKEGKMLNVGTSRDILNGITENLPFKRYMQHFTPLNIVKDTTTWNPIKSHSNFEVMMKYRIKNNNKGE